MKYLIDTGVVFDEATATYAAEATEEDIDVISLTLAFDNLSQYDINAHIEENDKINFVTYSFYQAESEEDLELWEELMSDDIPCD
jgi:hypothetical protein